MKEDRKLVFAFVLLCVAGLAFWILGVVEGKFDDMMRNVGVEILGAIITALGVIGLERIYAKADPQIDTLIEQITQQNQKIDALQKQLQVTHFQRRPKRQPPQETQVK